MTQVTPKMRQWLLDLAEGRSPLLRFSGRSQCGGAWSIERALIQRRLLDAGGELTDAGRGLVTEQKAGVP